MYRCATNSEGFFVVGDGGLGPESHSRVLFSGAKVESSKKVLGQELKDMLPDGDTVPFGVALITSKGRQYRDMVPDLPKLSKTKPYIYLNENPSLVEQLRDNAQDLVVYGRRAASDGCNIFQDIYPLYEGRAYLLREYDEDASLSINRCTIERYPFNPLVFQLGRPSPSGRNDCKNDVLPIIEANSRMPPAGGDVEMEQMEEERQVMEGSIGGCRPRSRSQSFYTERGTEDEMREIVREGSPEDCPIQDAGLENTMEEDLQVENANQVLRDSFGEGVQVPEWERTDRFDEGWIAFINEHQSDIHPIDVFDKKSVRTWYVHYPRNDRPRLSGHGCRLCRDNYEEMYLDPRLKPAFADEGGTFRSTKRHNRDAILRHEESRVHKFVVRGLKKRAAAKIPERFEVAQKKVMTDEEIDLEPTVNHVRSVFETICKLNVALESYERTVTLQKLNGINLGLYLANRQGATRTVSMLSSQFHDILIDKLRSNSFFISLICDESTDMSQRKYLAVLLQSFENEEVKMYNYRTIYLDDVVVSAEYLLEKLVEAFREDNLEATMKEYLRSFTSDGASVMVSLGEKLNDYVHHHLHRVHCTPHRIQLTLNKVTKEKQYHKKYIAIINSLASYYNEHKKRAHFRETGRQMGITRFVYPKKVIAIRWLPSLVVSMRNFNRGWPIFYKSLGAISQDTRRFSKKAIRTKAREILKAVRNRSVVLYHHFFEDMTQLMAEWTKFSEKQVGLLFEQVERKNNVITQLTMIKDGADGDHVKKFYDEVICTMRDGTVYGTNKPAGKCKEAQYFAAMTVTWKGELLSTENFIIRGKNAVVAEDEDEEDGEEEEEDEGPQPELATLQLKQIRESTLQTLIDEIERYFPEEDTDDWSIFDPKNLPTALDKFDDFGVSSVRVVAKSLGYEETVEELVQGWKKLMEILKEQDGICNPRQREENPAVFWPWVLRVLLGPRVDSDAQLLAIRDFVRHLLIIPANSAEAGNPYQYLLNRKLSYRY